MFSEVHRKLDRILELLEKQAKKETIMTQALTDELTALQAELANNTSVTSAAAAQLNGFAAQITAAVAAAVDDSAAVAAVKNVVAQFQANDAALATAVAVNTPAAPPTPAPLPPIVAAPTVTPVDPPVAPPATDPSAPPATT